MTSPLILGTFLDGDAHDLTYTGHRFRLGRTQHIGLAWPQLERHLLVIGGTGVGKTVTQLRLAQQALAHTGSDGQRPRVIYIDAKGLQGPERDAFLQMARHLGHERRLLWPDCPIDGLTGTPAQLRERLSGLFNTGESPYHHAEAVTMLDLALAAQPTPRTLRALLERLRHGATAAAHTDNADAAQAGEADRFTRSQWDSVYLRLRAILATVGDRLDHNDESVALASVDAAWISIPGVTSPQSAADIATWILALVGELTQHNTRPTLIILDEFSAIGTDERASRAAASLIERVRSAHVAVVIGTQSVPSLGAHAERLLHTVGTVLAHRTAMPDQLIELAGTRTAWEDTHELSRAGTRHATSGRRQQQFAINPDTVRTLPVGETILIHEGTWAQVAIRAPQGPNGPRRPR